MPFLVKVKMVCYFIANISGVYLINRTLHGCLEIQMSLLVFKNSSVVRSTHYRVHTGPGKPGMTGILLLAFSRTGKFWKKATGHGKVWKSVKLE